MEDASGCLRRKQPPIPGETTISQAGESDADIACSSRAGLDYAGEILGDPGVHEIPAAAHGVRMRSKKARIKALGSKNPADGALARGRAATSK